MSLSSTVSLEPEPIALDVKVVLLGERQLYYYLSQADPEFLELFKIAADFDDEFVPTTMLYANMPISSPPSSSKRNFYPLTVRQSAG